MSIAVSFISFQCLIYWRQHIQIILLCMHSCTYLPCLLSYVLKISLSSLNKIKSLKTYLPHQTDQQLRLASKTSWESYPGQLRLIPSCCDCETWNKIWKSPHNLLGKLIYYYSKISVCIYITDQTTFFYFLFIFLTLWALLAF